MDHADVVMLAEDRHAESLERKEARRETAAEALAAEYLACASMPLFTTVSTPTDEQPQRRTPFVDVFFDGLSWSKNSALQSRAIAVLMAHDRALMEELARQHGADYQEFAA